MPRHLRIVGPAALLLVAIVATLAGLAYGGGAQPQLLADPGAVVRWGLPVAKLLVNIGAAGTIGALVLTIIAGIKANDGVAYRYPFTWRLIK